MDEAKKPTNDKNTTVPVGDEIVDGGYVYKGRKVIYTDYEEINAENVAIVVSKALSQHQKNAKEIKFLMDYEKGRQPILNRVKEVRPEINNRVVENHAHEIVEFKDGYVFGSPITYVQRGAKDKKDENGSFQYEDDSVLAKLNEMLFEESKFYKDQELANTCHIAGVGYRAIIQQKNDSCPFTLLNLNPMTTFVIRSNDIFRRVVCAVSYSVDDTQIAKFGVYTKDRYYELVGSVLGMNLKLVKEEINGIGTIPIIEYKVDYNRMGCFERVLPLLDAINLATSDRVNGLEQFIQSLIWFNNIDVDAEQFEGLRAMGGIKTKTIDGQKADIKVVETNLNQVETQTLLDYLYDQVLQICGVPGREQSTGGNTGQAIMLGGSGWQLAETSAKKTEVLFGECDREALKVVVSILKKANKEMASIKISDIEIKFSRNKVSNLLTKTQGLLNQLNAGIHPRIAVANCDLYSDPQQVYIDSEEYFEKWKPAQANLKAVEQETTVLEEEAV